MSGEVSTEKAQTAQDAVAGVLAAWGVRSQHGEWGDRETQMRAADDVLRALAGRCRNCELPIRRNDASTSGYEHFPDPPDPTKGWQGIRCPGRLTGADPIYAPAGSEDRG